MNADSKNNYHIIKVHKHQCSGSYYITSEYPDTKLQHIINQTQYNRKTYSNNISIYIKCKSRLPHTCFLKANSNFWKKIKGSTHFGNPLCTWVANLTKSSIVQFLYWECSGHNFVLNFSLWKIRVFFKF